MMLRPRPGRRERMSAVKASPKSKPKKCVDFSGAIGGVPMTAAQISITKPAIKRMIGG